jgi:hypothetical protein
VERKSDANTHRSRAGSAIWTSSGAGLSASAQYEAWTFPVIRPETQMEMNTSLQIAFWLGSQRRSAAKQ